MSRISPYFTSGAVQALRLSWMSPYFLSEEPRTRNDAENTSTKSTRSSILSRGYLFIFAPKRHEVHGRRGDCVSTSKDFFIFPRQIDATSKIVLKIFSFTHRNDAKFITIENISSFPHRHDAKFKVVVDISVFRIDTAIEVLEDILHFPAKSSRLLRPSWISPYLLTKTTRSSRSSWRSQSFEFELARI